MKITRGPNSVTFSECFGPDVRTDCHYIKHGPITAAEQQRSEWTKKYFAKHIEKIVFGTLKPPPG